MKPKPDVDITYCDKPCDKQCQRNPVLYDFSDTPLVWYLSGDVCVNEKYCYFLEIEQ